MVPLAVKQVGDILETGRIAAVVFRGDDDDTIGNADPGSKVKSLGGRGSLESQPLHEEGELVLFQIEDLGPGKVVLLDVFAEIEGYTMTASLFTNAAGYDGDLVQGAVF